MKKATKLLTAVATAAALILGASAFVSCSNSSSDDTPADTRSKDEKTYSAKVAEAQDFVKNHQKFAISEGVTDKKLTDEATAYNTAFDSLEKLLTEEALEETADSVEEAREWIPMCEQAVAAGKGAEDVAKAIEAINKLSEDDKIIGDDTKVSEFVDVEEAKKISDKIDENTKISEIEEKEIFDKILDLMLEEAKAAPDGIFAEATKNIEKALEEAKTALDAVGEEFLEDKNGE